MGSLFTYLLLIFFVIYVVWMRKKIFCFENNSIDSSSVMIDCTHIDIIDYKKSKAPSTTKSAKKLKNKNDLW